MKEQLLSFYAENRSVLRFKGNRPGEDPATRINEYALVGDKWLSMQVAGQLFNAGYDAASITNAISSTLSNRNMSYIADKVGLQIGASIHSNGTLLEAMVGLWVQASFNMADEDARDFYGRHTPLFLWLLSVFMQDALDYLSASSLVSAYKRTIQGIAEIG